MKRGLYFLPGISATAMEAPWPSWFEGPTTKLPNVYLGFRPDWTTVAAGRGGSAWIVVGGGANVGSVACAGPGGEAAGGAGGKSGIACEATSKSTYQLWSSWTFNSSTMSLR